MRGRRRVLRVPLAGPTPRRRSRSSSVCLGAFSRRWSSCGRPVGPLRRPTCRLVRTGLLRSAGWLGTLTRRRTCRCRPWPGRLGSRARALARRGRPSLEGRALRFRVTGRRRGHPATIGFHSGCRFPAGEVPVSGCRRAWHHGWCSDSTLPRSLVGPRPVCDRRGLADQQRLHEYERKQAISLSVLHQNTYRIRDNLSCWSWRMDFLFKVQHSKVIGA